MIGHTLTLDLDTWDLTLDSGGNIATSTGAYGIAQNVANASRLFTQDAYYNPERGIPHFVLDLGRKIRPSLVRSRLVGAALGVEGVRQADVSISGIKDRVLTGNITLILNDGATADVTF